MRFHNRPILLSQASKFPRSGMHSPLRFVGPQQPLITPPALEYDPFLNAQVVQSTVTLLLPRQLTQLGCIVRHHSATSVLPSFLDQLQHHLHRWRLISTSDLHSTRGATYSLPQWHCFPLGAHCQTPATYPPDGRKLQSKFRVSGIQSAVPSPKLRVYLEHRPPHRYETSLLYHS